MQVVEEWFDTGQLYSSPAYKAVKGFNQIQEQKKSFNSRITEHHRMLIEMSLKHIEYIEEMIEKLEMEMDGLIKGHKLDKDVELLDTIPGVDKIGASIIIAETGADMRQFPSASHLASWAGMSPGNNESAGKKKAEGPVQETSG